MCGIIGVFGSENAASMAALGLFAEQHRGQESCGMAVSDGLVIRLRKKMGLVKEVFNDEHLSYLPGTLPSATFVTPPRAAPQNLTLSLTWWKPYPGQPMPWLPMEIL